MITELELDAVNGTILLISFAILWYILREISKRLGTALHMPKYYRLYDLSMVLALAAYLTGFVEYSIMTSHNYSAASILSTLVGLMFLAGAVIMVGVTVRYWSWIVPEVLALRKK